MIKFGLLMRLTAYLLHKASKDLYCNYDRKEVGWIQKERAGVMQMGYLNDMIKTLDIASAFIHQEVY